MNSVIVEKANRIIGTCKNAYIGLIDDQGFPVVSTIGTLNSESIFDSYFVTGTRSNKYKCLKKNKRGSVCYHDGSNNITLIGEIEVLTDQETKSRFWQPWFTEFFPLGETDPAYCVLKFHTKRVLLWIDGESAAFNIDEI